MSNYLKIIRENLKQAFQKAPEILERSLPATRQGDSFSFRAFGRDCLVSHDSIFLDGKSETGPMGVIISIYVKHVDDHEVVVEPFRSFREFPESMPYQGPFKVNTESVLVPYVERIKESMDLIISRFDGSVYNRAMGDFAFVLYPLPRIALLYDFYMPDEEFPASVTCRFSSNANLFMPLDGLADVGEYTSKEIIETVK